MPTASRRGARYIAAIVLATLFVVPHSVSSSGAEIEALWKDYIVAKKRFQFDLSKLMTDKWPELGGVARLQRDQQYAMIEMRNMKFQYLLENDPDRLVMDEGLSKLANFEWTDADSEALRSSNPDYATLERWAELNSQRLSDHPNLPTAARRFEELQHEEIFRSMIERFELRMDDLETTLSLVARKARRTTEKPTPEPVESPDTD